MIEAPLGYSAPAWLKSRLRELSKTSLLRSVLSAVAAHLLILGSGLLASHFLSRMPLAHWIPLYVVTAIVAAREMRALECLVHDASHYNWTRRRKLNDLLANLLAAWPVLSEVDSYRRTHLVHHQFLGGDADTDLIRWRKLNLRGLDRTRLLPFAKGIALRLVPYVPGWWRAIGVGRGTVLRFIAWHVVAVAGGAFILDTPLPSILRLWGLCWGVPVFFILPVIRFLGEIEEHEYKNLRSVMGATYSNVGPVQKLLLHPLGDAYHTVHHLFPSIPFFRVKRVHRELVENDPRGYGDTVSIRRRILS